MARAVTFVDGAIAAVGPERFDPVWTTPGLVPTLEELRRPRRWITRLPAA
ncbi:zinc-dependent metalloprotease [Streptomyces prunicolor]